MLLWRQEERAEHLAGLSPGLMGRTELIWSKTEQVHAYRQTHQQERRIRSFTLCGDRCEVHTSLWDGPDLSSHFSGSHSRFSTRHQFYFGRNSWRNQQPPPLPSREQRSVNVNSSKIWSHNSQRVKYPVSGQRATVQPMRAGAAIICSSVLSGILRMEGAKC